MTYQLDIKENAIDSLNEALAKYRDGKAGQVRAYKFSILHMAHFLELVLKMYVQSLAENLIYLANFQRLQEGANGAGVDLLSHLHALKTADFVFLVPQCKKPPPKTIRVEQAQSLAKLERCVVTNNLLVDDDFIEDINWLKSLRNNIEHFRFEIEPKDVRLCIGRIVRRAEEFADIFSLFDLAAEVGKENADLYRELADEYEHGLREAKLEVREREYEAFKGIRLKFHDQVDWHVYNCPECNQETLIPEPDSSTGYRCTNCKNEDSDEIEIPCDCCGATNAMEEMDQWETDDGELEWRCYFCTGQYAMDKDDS